VRAMDTATVNGVKIEYAALAAFVAKHPLS
jgi:hypothetical protein